MTIEVTLKAGDSLNIPEGCKAVVKGNVVVFEKEKKEEFKDGDILNVIYEKNKKCPFIYKGIDAKGFYLFYAGIDIIGNLFLCPNEEYRWGNERVSHATEEEKQTLFNKMKEQGLHWNAEKKCVEKLRWRAGIGEEYYFIDSSLDVMKIDGCCSSLCNKHY